MLPFWLILEKYNRSLSAEQTGLLQTKYKDVSSYLRPRSFYISALLISTIVFFGAYTWYLSLHITIPSANNAIYQSASAFVFLFSVFFTKESVTALKILAVGFSVGGVVLVTVFHDKGTNKVDDSPIGYVLVIISTCTYALYEVLAKKCIPQVGGKFDRFVNSLAMLSCIGIFSIITMWPGLIIVHYGGFEKFQIPSPHIGSLIVLNMALDTIFNLLLLFGIALSSPLFVSVGSMLVIPATLITDVIIDKIHVPVGVVMGCILIAVAFGLLHRNHQSDTKEHADDDMVSVETAAGDGSIVI